MTDCILVPANHSAGYRTVTVGGRSEYAHRLAYQEAKGEIPEGYTIDHLCRVRNCINPDHLEAVTRGENVRRGLPFRAPVTHCASGHDLAVYARANGSCGECATRRSRAWYERHHPEARPRRRREIAA